MTLGQLWGAGQSGAQKRLFRKLLRSGKRNEEESVWESGGRTRLEEETGLRLMAKGAGLGDC